MNTLFNLLYNLYTDKSIHHSTIKIFYNLSNYYIIYLKYI